jgi:hypothetical protein
VAPRVAWSINAPAPSHWFSHPFSRWPLSPATKPPGGPAVPANVQPARAHESPLGRVDLRPLSDQEAERR